MYRENIYDIMKSTGEKISTLVIPKNKGLKSYAWLVLKEAGLEIDDAKQAGNNMMKIGELDLILKRGEDIPKTIIDYAGIGKIALGITGDDFFDEFRLRQPGSQLKLENTYDWYDESAIYLRPALCLINKTGKLKDIPLEAKVAINAKYMSTSRDYLLKSKIGEGRAFKEAIYAGDVERTVDEGINDCAIDIVYSGRTLDECGLKVVQKIRFSDIVVISPLKPK